MVVRCLKVWGLKTMVSLGCCMSMFECFKRFQRFLIKPFNLWWCSRAKMRSLESIYVRLFSIRNDMNKSKTQWTHEKPTKNCLRTSSQQTSERTKTMNNWKTQWTHETLWTTAYEHRHNKPVTVQRQWATWKHNEIMKNYKKAIVTMAKPVNK